MFHFNVDFAVECVKSVCDNNRCVTCDKLLVPFVRFPCGHSVCEDCAQRTGECLFCVSPNVSYMIDKPQTARVNNAAHLLNTFQDTFNINVLKRQRISDHLKVEKQLFPECIQATHKYSNKRKSLNTSNQNKENTCPTFFPGEGVKGSEKVIMEKSYRYVQNWLNQHETMPQNLPRRPFGDINTNTHTLVHKSKRDAVKLKSVPAPINAKHSTYRKRTHLKSIHKTSSLLKHVPNILETKNPEKQLEAKNSERCLSDSLVSHDCDKNESGIVLDDEAIVVEDTDMQTIDKDEQASLAVLERAKKDEYEMKNKNELQKPEGTNNILEIYKLPDSTLTENKIIPKKIACTFPKNVCFYKRSSLFETCNLCKNYVKNESSSNVKLNKNNDISIVIDNSDFVTTIHFTQCQENKKAMCDKKSISVQTDQIMSLFENELSTFDGNKTAHKRKNLINSDEIPTKISKHQVISQSLDVFASDKDIEKHSSDGFLKQPKCLIIEDSDTDSNVSCNKTQEVAVDIHRTNAPESVECGVLKTLSRREYEHKTKRQVRGHTPNSSNSSDKENLDPNKKKGVKLKKKHKNKK